MIKRLTPNVQYSRKGSNIYSTGKIYSLYTTEFYFGEYHNLHSGSPPYLSPQQTAFSWFDYPMGDPYNADDYATVVGEPLANSRAEVPSQLFIARNIFSGGSVTGTWYRDRDKKVLYTFTIPIPDPSTQGYTYWDWYAVWSWIGKFPHEMSEPGHYFVTVETTWGSHTHDFDFNAKWRCDPSTGQCIIDPNGPYNTLLGCQTDCVACPSPVLTMIIQ